VLQVVFTQLDDNDIRKFEKMDFTNMVEITANLEKKYRDAKKKINGDFYLIEKDSDGTPIYTGTFNFGSYYAPNLYQHIKKKLDEMKLSKQQQQDRIELIAKMEEGLPENYKKEEVFENVHLLDLDIRKVSKLTRWQRRTIYALTGLLSLALIGLIFYTAMTIAQYDVAYKKEHETVLSQNKTLGIYEQGLLGNKKELNKYLYKNKKGLTNDQKKLYAVLLLQDKKYKEVVDLYNNDLSFIAALISSTGNIDMLREFNKDFPSKEGEFDILYADKKYEELLTLKNVDMTVKRSEMKTYALLKTGRIEEAKAELTNNNNKDMKKKIVQYEELSKEINGLNSAIEVAKNNQNNDEVQALTNKETEIQNKLNAL
jgi:hypothetical protein